MTDSKKSALPQEEIRRSLADELLADYVPPPKARAPAQTACPKCSTPGMKTRASSVGGMVFLKCMKCRHEIPVASLESPILAERDGLAQLARSAPGPYYGERYVPESDVPQSRRGILVPRRSDD